MIKELIHDDKLLAWRYRSVAASSSIRVVSIAADWPPLPGSPPLWLWLLWPPFAPRALPLTFYSLFPQRRRSSDKDKERRKCFFHLTTVFSRVRKMPWLLCRRSWLSLCLACLRSAVGCLLDWFSKTYVTVNFKPFPVGLLAFNRAVICCITSRTIEYLAAFRHLIWPATAWVDAKFHLQLQGLVVPVFLIQAVHVLLLLLPMLLMIVILADENEMATYILTIIVPEWVTVFSCE